MNSRNFEFNALFLMVGPNEELISVILENIALKGTEEDGYTPICIADELFADTLTKIGYEYHSFLDTISTKGNTENFVQLRKDFLVWNAGYVYTRGFPLQHSGFTDMSGHKIFEGHILDNIAEVVFCNLTGQWMLKYPKATELIPLFERAQEMRVTGYKFELTKPENDGKKTTSEPKP